MAEDRNVVEIIVTSRNKTRAGFKEAEAEAEVTASRISMIFSRVGANIHKKLAESMVMSNLGRGGGLFALGAGALSMVGPLGAAGAALGAFGAIAIPILHKVMAAHQALAKAQQAYANATTNKQRVAALKAEEVATQGLTGSQKGLMGQVGQLGKMWGDLEGKMTPVVVGVASMALKLGSALLPAMDKLVPAGAKLIGAIVGPLTAFVRSKLFDQLIGQMTQMAGQVGSLLGPQLVNLIKLFLQLFVQAGPAGIQLLNILLPLIIQLASDLVPVIAFVAKLVAGILQWLQNTHLLLPLLAVVAVAILAMEAPITAVIAAVAVLIAIGVELARHWGAIWGFIHRVIMDVWDWIRDHWRLLLPILLGPMGLAVDFIVAHWHTIMHWASVTIDFIRSHWRLVLEILLGPIGAAVVLIIDHWHQIAHALGALVGFIASHWSQVYHLIVDPFVQAYNVIKPIFDAIGSAVSAISHAAGGIGGVLNFMGLASGGIVGAAAGGLHGGLRLVGEHGPELAVLPGGSHVFSNSQTRGMLGGGRGGGAPVIVVQPGGGALDEMFVSWLKNVVRDKGGGGPYSVQKALGRTWPA